MAIPKTIQDKLNEGRQYRNIDVTGFEAREEDGKKVVEGYATVFNTPYLLWSMRGYEVWEEIDPAAFDDCDMDDVIMQYNHEGRVFARTRNKTLEVKADKVGLKTRADLGGTSLGMQVYEEIKGGYTDRMSFGFVVKEDKREVTEDKETGMITVHRKITKISKLYDVSAVSIPANDATSISARNFGEGVIAEIMEEIQKRERQKQKIRILARCKR